MIEPALPPHSAKVLLLLSSKVITIFVVAVQLSAAIAEPPAILGSVDWSQLSVHLVDRLDWVSLHLLL